MNKISNSKGIAKPQELREFQNKLDVRIHNRQRFDRMQPVKNIRISGPQYLAAERAFGRANRPQTPVKGIIQGNYEAETEQLF